MTMNDRIRDADMLISRYRASLEALRSVADDVALLLADDGVEAERRLRLGAHELRRALAACRRAAGEDP